MSRHTTNENNEILPPEGMSSDGEIPIPYVDDGQDRPDHQSDSSPRSLQRHGSSSQILDASLLTLDPRITVCTLGPILIDRTPLS